MTAIGFALAPLILVGLAFGALLALAWPDQGLAVVMATTKLAGALGCLAAAQGFDAGDYLRRAWLVSAAAMAFLFMRDVLVTTGLDAALPAPAWWLGGLVLACNVTTVYGLWLMARVFNAVGLASEQDEKRWRAYMRAALLVAIALTFPSLRATFEEFQKGEPRAIAWFFSAVGDALSLALVAPMLLTAVAMRGGLLIWPWALLTVSIAAWLLYDIASVLAYYGLLSAASMVMVERFFSAVASMYTAAAGLAQRHIVRRRPT